LCTPPVTLVVKRYTKKKNAAKEAKPQSPDTNSLAEEKSNQNNIKREESDLNGATISIKKEEQNDHFMPIKKEAAITSQTFITPPIRSKVEESASSTQSSENKITTTQKKHSKGAEKPKGSKGATSGKNIIKNYGRALQNFAISNMSLPYINPLLQKENTTLKDF